MKWYALSHLGAEQALKKELKRLGVDAQTLTGACEFEADKKTAASILYRTQCSTRLLAALAYGPHAELDLSSAHDIIPEEATFRVEVDMQAGSPDDHTSIDLASELGSQISRPVDLDDAEYCIFVQITSTAIAGIDVFGDLSKRYYRIFGNARSVKGTLAASILELYLPQKNLLDPFGNTGEVCIEAALRATNTSPLRYEKHKHATILEEYKEWDDQRVKSDMDIWCYDRQLGNLRSSKKNAKLAGVSDALSFSKLDPEWMDVKFKENDLGCILTIPPAITKRNTDDSHIEELCYQAEFVLRNTDGILVVCCLNDETTFAMAKYAKKYKLKLLNEHMIYSGKLAHHIVCYGL